MSEWEIVVAWNQSKLLRRLPREKWRGRAWDGPGSEIHITEIRVQNPGQSAQNKRHRSYSDKKLKSIECKASFECESLYMFFSMKIQRPFSFWLCKAKYNIFIEKKMLNMNFKSWSNNGKKGNLTDEERKEKKQWLWILNRVLFCRDGDERPLCSQN